MKYAPNTDFKAVRFDELLPAFRDRTLEIPGWAYDLSRVLASYEGGGNSSFVTDGGITTTSGETKAAIYAAMFSAYVPVSSAGGPITPDGVKALLLQLTDDQRLECFAGFCQGCGKADPRCHCRHDD